MGAAVSTESSDVSAATEEQVDLAAGPKAAPAGARRWGILLAMLVVIVGVDQATKLWAIETLKDQPARTYLGGSVMMFYAENRGAFGSMFAGMSDEARWYVLTVGCTVMLLAVGAYLLGSKEIDRLSFYGLCFILAGGIGNLIDRIQYGTVVIDFLYIGFGDSWWQHTNVFNVADVSIVAGFLLLVFPMLRDVVRPAAKSA